MPDEPLPESVAKPGVARIVKLGLQTLLITRIENGDEVPEGEITINAIEAVPAEVEDAAGADVCGGQCSCLGKADICIVKGTFLK
ncbi:hypothetical protein [Mycolicibacterium sp. 624]|uniref:hypothetical protein n=1 Tax=Mycolicibacterium sp. 624 TaxID=3156314 RepID=UPI003397FC0E